MNIRILLAASSIAVFTLLQSGCSEKSDAAAISTQSSPVAPASAAASSAPASSAVSVTTVPAQTRTLPILLKATGTITPINTVEVRSQVTSVINKVHFHEGQFVKVGDLLFTLDARTEEANVTKAQAQLTRDKASLADSQRQLDRSKQLLAQNFISQGAVDTSQTQYDAQSALVASDQATIEATRVPLSYSRITAPNSGRVGAVNVFPGSTVQANVTTLVTITQMDPMAVTFNLPQRNLQEALGALKTQAADVTATLPDGGGSFSGHLQFVDNAVDMGSGTVKVKGVFDNHDNKLWPGAFVDIGLTAGTLKDSVVIPQATIILSARGAIVYAVADGKAVAWPVQVLYSQGDTAAVSGVTAGERIVLDGRQNLRPGVPVVERAKDSFGTKASADKVGGVKGAATATIVGQGNTP